MPPGITPLLINDFSGGWNPRDAFSELAANESPDCLNVSLDERGGIVKRLGLTNLSGSSTPLTNAASNLFYWPSTGQTIVQDGTAIKKTADFVTFTTIKTYSTNARATFCEFNGKLIAVHPVDRVSTYDNTTWTDLGAGTPQGTCIANWQNRVWVGNGVRLQASAIGDVTTWAAGDFNDIREKDDSPITAIGAGQGMDIVGRPGLLVYKQRSVHRVYDSKSGATFGAYATIDTKAGASGPLAVGQTPDGTIAFINPDGIYETDGEKVTLISSKLSTLFRDVQLNFSVVNNWAVGVFHDRLLFSIARGVSQTTNNFTLEYNPRQGWIVPHSFGHSCYTVNRYNRRKLYGANPTVGKLYDVFSGGSDDGAAIAARYNTRWFEPAGGYQIRMRRLLVEGRGSYLIFTRPDYTLDAGTEVQFSSTTLDSVWGTGNWGTAIWGSSLYEDIRPFWELGVARAVSWNLTETSSTSAIGPKLLQDGAAPEIGKFALYGLKLDYVRLGTS